MRVLLAADLHYDLRKFDWLVSRAADYDLVAIAGDLLGIASGVPLDVQITVALEYLTVAGARTKIAVCSGNHDLDSVTDGGEKQTRWLTEARAAGVLVDGDTETVEGWQVTCCPWWEGPATLARLAATLASRPAADRQLWVWHGPPAGPLAWTGTRAYDDPELPALLSRHAPQIVLCGHIHQAPFVDGGDWSQQLGSTWLFNAGHQLGPIPSYIELDLSAGTALHVSQLGERGLVLR